MGEEKNENVNTAPEQPQPDRAANAQPVEEETETPRAKILGRKENGKVDVKQTAENLKNEFLAMKRRSRIMLVAAIVAALVISITTTVLLNRTKYAVLYSGLDSSTAGEILNALSKDGVDAKMQGDSSILVPADQVSTVKAKLAAEGYPKTGLNYDTFSDTSKFGSTDAETQARLQYTLQENIRTTINEMDKIKDSIVIVNLPQNSSYVVSNTKTAATAAVMLQLDSGETIDDSEAVSIAKFVMKSVPELQMKNISIVDDRMHSYDLTGSSSASEKYSATQMQLAEEMKKTLTDQALKILEPVVGTGNVSVSVNLALNFDKKTQSSVQFSPPVEGETEGMLRSKQESSSYSGTNGTTSSDAAGTASNGVSGTQYQTGNTSAGNSGDNTLTYNYELNEIQTKLEKAQGTVKDLSVSVLINSKASGAKKAASSASKLVANAIGVKKNYITVSSLPFVQSAGGSSFSSLLQASQSAGRQALLLSILKIVIPCLTILLVAVLVLRHLKRKRKDEEEAEALDMDVEEGEAPRNAEGRPVKRKPVTNEDLADDLMQSKSGEAEKVEKLVEEYPDAAVQILRNWLTEN
jgi:flagellar M-ring protein FliF